MSTGTGAYTLQEASRYSGVGATFISRWLFGKNRLWEPQLADTGWKGVGFHDLLELKIVNEFRQKGVSLQLIRQALNSARELYGHTHPFLNRRFATDGKRIFAEAESLIKVREPLIDLAARQYVLDEVIRPSLHEGFVFDGNSIVKWHPDTRKFSSVVLDPFRSFGKPIVESVGIKTSILYNAVAVEKDKMLVSRLFDVPVAAVTAAVRYEKDLDSRLVYDLYV